MSRQQLTDILNSMYLDMRPSARIEAMGVSGLGLIGTGNQGLAEEVSQVLDLEIDELFRFFGPSNTPQVLDA